MAFKWYVVETDKGIDVMQVCDVDNEKVLAGFHMLADACSFAQSQREYYPVATPW